MHVTKIQIGVLLAAVLLLSASVATLQATGGADSTAHMGPMDPTGPTDATDPMDSRVRAATTHPPVLAESRLEAPSVQGETVFLPTAVPANAAFEIKVAWGDKGPSMAVRSVPSPTEDPLELLTEPTTGNAGCLRSNGIPFVVDFPWANDPPNMGGCQFQFIRSPIHETVAYCASNGDSCFIEATSGHSIWFDPHRFILRCWGNGVWHVDWSTGEILNGKQCDLTQWGDPPHTWTGYSSICASNFGASVGLNGCLHRGASDP